MQTSYLSKYKFLKWLNGNILALLPWAPSLVGPACEARENNKTLYCTLLLGVELMLVVAVVVTVVEVAESVVAKKS